MWASFSMPPASANRSFADTPAGYQSAPSAGAPTERPRSVTPGGSTRPSPGGSSSPGGGDGPASSTAAVVSPGSSVAARLAARRQQWEREETRLREAREARQRELAAKEQREHEVRCCSGVAKCVGEGVC